MKSKKILAFSSLILLAVFPLIPFKKVLAVNSATVNATVTLQNVSVSIGDGSISYGTLSSNESKSTIASDLNDTQTITNNGNVAEDINIKGQDSVNWTLSGTAGIDQYVHEFCTDSCTIPPTNFTALTTNYQTLGANVAVDGTKSLDLRITTPTSSSVFTQQSVDVVIQAVAH